MHIVDDPKQILLEIHRVLKDDGLFITPTFIWNKENKMIQRLLSIVGFTVNNFWNFNSYCSFLKENNFNSNYSEIILSSVDIAFVVVKKLFIIDC